MASIGPLTPKNIIMIIVQTCHIFIPFEENSLRELNRLLKFPLVLLLLIFIPTVVHSNFNLQRAESRENTTHNSRFTSLCILSNISISSDFAEFKDKSESESVSCLADVVGELWKSLVFWRWELSGGSNKTFGDPFFSVATASSSSILKLTVDGRHMLSKSWTNNQQSTHMLAFIWSGFSFQVANLPPNQFYLISIRLS